MPYVQVKKKYQITIPVALRKQIKLNEGDMLEAKILDGMIVFVPQILGSKESAFYKSNEKETSINIPNEETQKAMKEADDNKTYDIKDVDAFFKDKPTKKESWKNLPACGMWQDREDMKNPTEYVNKLREPRYQC